MGGNLHSQPSIVHALASCIQLLDTYCPFTHRPFPGSVGLVLAMVRVVPDLA